MKKETKKNLYIFICLLTMFVIWTFLVYTVDVQAIGPNRSTVGFATLNRSFHEFTGVHISLYNLTDWFSLIPLGIVVGFAILGLVQWIKRKDILSVDRSIIALGVFYIIVFAVFIFFEFFVINYRPVLIDGKLETSYPSSTTMLVMCVMPTAMMQFNARMKNKRLKPFILLASTAFITFMVVCRLISGVHWMTDIIGGVLLSSALVILYNAYK